MAVLEFRDRGSDDSRRGFAARSEYPYDHRRIDTEPDDFDAEYVAAFSADAEADLAAHRHGWAATLARTANWLGALVSVLLLVGLAVWGYRLVARDVSGIPIIRALEGESRTSPDDPGGQLSQHTGLAVNTVAAGGDPSLPDEIGIAPASTGLTEDDVAMGEFGATAREPSANLQDMTVPDDADPVAMPFGEPSITDALTEADGVTPVEKSAISEALAEANQIKPNVSIPNGSAAVAQSDRPLARPAGREAPAAAAAPEPAPQAEEAAAETAAPAPAPTESVQAVDPGAIPAGTALVQIGAFDSQADAESEWVRISGKFGSLFDGKGRVIQTAESNGRTFVRLRVTGFESKDEARNFCAALVAKNAACIPATAK